jgi:hypothetical protein
MNQLGLRKKHRFGMREILGRPPGAAHVNAQNESRTGLLTSSSEQVEKSE